MPENGDEASGVEGPVCFVNDGEGSGFRYQCAGQIDFGIEFDLANVDGANNCADAQALLPNEPLCHEFHTFGDEPYEQSIVAACCEEWDEDPETTPIYQAGCAADMANQVCHTFRDRLIHHRAWKHFGNGDLDDQAGNIINYLAYNINSCTSELLLTDSNPDPAILDSIYALPNDPQSWPLWVNFVLSVQIGEIEAFSLPEQPGSWLACEAINENDSDVFPGQWPGANGSSYPALLASSTGAKLSGPEYFGWPVTGSATMASASTSCNSPWCSQAEFVIDHSSDQWGISALEMVATADVTLGNILVSHEIAGVRIHLDSPARGRIEDRGSDVYVISAGDAMFWLAGADAGNRGASDRVLLPNSSDIIAEFDAAGGEWSLAPFDLQFKDYNGEIWKIAISASTWN